MKNLFNTYCSLAIIFCICIPTLSFSQKQEVEVELQQSDNRIRVRMFHHHSSTLFGAFSQDYRVTIENLTQDKLLVNLEFSAHLSCGIKNNTRIGPFNEGVTLGPREFVGEKFGTDGKSMAVRLGDNTCPRNTLIKLGKDKNGSDLYSAISSLSYRLIRIDNISEKERAEADTKKKKEEEEKKANDFWSDSRRSSNTQVSKDENIRSAKQFGGGLDDMNEGEYFKDNKGVFYKKEKGNARIVSKEEYDHAKSKEVMQQIARQEQQREEKMQLVNEAINTSMDILTTSFYTQQMARGIKDATQLHGDFNSVEELNAAFQQQLSAISSMSQELRAASIQNMNKYTSTVTANATTAADQTYATALSVVGGVAASISADRAERKAREELRRERAEAEAEIKERQRVALVKIRNEINKTFTEGGMPLSSHKIDAPVLFLFAYATDKTAWEKDLNIPLSISNVIPVYRYKDGTYPYTTNVKRTFEDGGLKEPKIIGYFTDKNEAEKYRASLIDLAPSAKFTIKNIEISVKEQNAGNTTGHAASNTDFWGMPIKKNETKNDKEIQL